MVTRRHDDRADVREAARCPAGHALRGTLERLVGVCEIGSDGSWGSAATGTEVYWDEARTRTVDSFGVDTTEDTAADDLPVLVCVEGCEYTDARVTFDVLNGTADAVCGGSQPTVAGFPCGDAECVCAPTALAVASDPAAERADG